MTTVDRAVAVNVLANAVDPDGGVLSVMPSFTQPSHGVVSLNADGSFTYTPSSGYRGVDTFTYTVTDGKGGMATGSVTVRVAPGVCDVVCAMRRNGNCYRPHNGLCSLLSLCLCVCLFVVAIDPPVQTAAAAGSPRAADDVGTTNVNTAVVVDVLANDSDPDGDTVAVASLTMPSNGVASLNADGTITYTPNAGYTGIDTFTYTIEDGNGGTATVRITGMCRCS